MSDRHPYRYKPLREKDEIRLLALSPAEDVATPLSCSIVHYQRSTGSIEYSAFSYTWGDEEFTETLKVVEGHLTNRQEISCCSSRMSPNLDVTFHLDITPTVNTLLRHFRTPAQVLYLWIDAICLNQYDHSEKAHQIPQMGRIYREAKDVKIWLGDEDELTAKQYACLLELEMFSDMKERVYVVETILAGSETKKMVLSFFQKPWFSRRWVIQEAVLAKTAMVYCGQYTIPLSVVSAATRALPSGMHRSYSVQMASSLAESRDSERSLLKDLWRFHDADCREKKDRVAALVGLSANNDDHNNDGFQLEYNTNWKDIYKQVASFQLHSVHRHARVEVLFHLFEFGPVFTPEDLEHPCWVPNWSKTRKRTIPYIPMKTSDISANYLLPQTVSDLADLSLCDNTLKIQPHLRENTTHVWRIDFLQYPSSDHHFPHTSKQLCDIIDLFVPPSAAESFVALYALSFLVEKFVMLSRFRSDVETFHVKDEIAEEFELYIEIRSRLSTDSGDIKYGFLNLLGAVLQDFCLLDLKSPTNQASPDPNYWAIGIGPKETMQTDILIPLWRWEDTSTYHPLDNQRSVHFTTMLVVRYDEGQLPQLFGCSVTGAEAGKIRGRIVGPAVCVEIDRTTDTEPGRDMGKERFQIGRLVRSWWASMVKSRRKTEVMINSKPEGGEPCFYVY